MVGILISVLVVLGGGASLVAHSSVSGSPGNSAHPVKVHVSEDAGSSVNGSEKNASVSTDAHVGIYIGL